MAQGILDTSDALPSGPLITAVTLAELSVGPLVDPSDFDGIDGLEVVNVAHPDH